MTKFYKNIDNGYFVAIGTGNHGIGITEAEYNGILDLIRHKPQAESGFDYRLREDLTWEFYELPPMPEDDEEATIEDYDVALTD